MDMYKINSVTELIKGQPLSRAGALWPDAARRARQSSAYFIMGRSANSRNRIFALKEGDGIFTEPFDASKVEDPSLIIYAAVRSYENKLVVTNGDQTDTIVAGLKEGKSFSAGPLLPAVRAGRPQPHPPHQRPCSTLKRAASATR